MNKGIFIKTSEKQLIKVNCNAIKWIQALDNYVRIATDDGQYVVRTTMKAISAKLESEQFLRIHRSYIVNVDRIDSIAASVCKVDYDNIPISRGYRRKLMHSINVA